MSWPDDDEPRFTITTLTGSKGNIVAAQVVDRAYGHQLVREYESKKGRTRTPEAAVARARGFAAQLNELDLDNKLDKEGEVRIEFEE